MFVSIALLLFLYGFNQDLTRVKIRIQNKNLWINETVRFAVENKSTDTLKVYFSLQVGGQKTWNDIYTDIYHLDRETLKTIMIMPKSVQSFSYAISNINSLFRKKIGKSPLRIEMIGFYKNFKKGIYKKHTETFHIKK
jgi:hypothetical protein